jgi:hypothetical protein
MGYPIECQGVRGAQLLSGGVTRLKLNRGFNRNEKRLVSQRPFCQAMKLEKMPGVVNAAQLFMLSHKRWVGKHPIAVAGIFWPIFMRCVCSESEILPKWKTRCP